MRKLTRTELATIRYDWWERQGKRCDLCGLSLKLDEAVMDHDHSTGVCRGVLHRGCNALLGKIENNHKRYGVPQVGTFLHGAASYLTRHAFPVGVPLIYPTHKTDEDKRLARNARARKARAAKKKAKT
jgi:hypothetical protein